MKKIYFNFMFVALAINCYAGKTHTCPDGSIVVIQKHPEKFYKVFTKTFEANLKGSADILEKVNLKDIDASLKTKVTELRDKLNQYSSQLQMLLQNSFLATQTAPCDVELRKSNSELLKSMQADNTALEKLKTEMQALLNSGNIGATSSVKIKQLLEEFNANKSETSPILK